jgi:hypothetical protein
MRILRACRDQIEREIGFFVMCGENAYSPTFREPEASPPSYPPKRQVQSGLDSPVPEKRVKLYSESSELSEDLLLELSDKSTPLKFNDIDMEMN